MVEEHGGLAIHLAGIIFNDFLNKRAIVALNRSPE